jgi:tyrosinase
MDPFTNIRAKYYDVKYNPHCLSRGFRDEEGNLGHMNGDAISPDSIEGVLRLDDYEKFVVEMESRVHDRIPFGIGEDFETFTAPHGKHQT